MPEVLQLRRELKVRWRIVFVTTLVLYAIVIIVAVLAWRDSNHKSDALRAQTVKTRELTVANRDLAIQNRKLATATRQLALRTNKALCTLRADYVIRQRDGQKFLAEHPNGIPGISAATIRNGLTNQQRTINALVSLPCPPILVP